MVQGFKITGVLPSDLPDSGFRAWVWGYFLQIPFGDSGDCISSHWPGKAFVASVFLLLWMFQATHTIP